MESEHEEIGQVVTTDRTPTFSTVHVQLHPGKSVRPGELLLIEVEREKLYSLGRVVEGIEINPYETPEKAHTRRLLGLESISQREELPRKYRVIEVDVIEEVFNRGGETYFREPQTLIPASSKVLRAHGEMAVKVLGFLPKGTRHGLFVGHAVGSNIPVVLDVNAVLPRHILIVGTTGTGKSYLRGVLAEEISEAGIPQVNIDVHGEMVKATTELGGQNMIPGKDLTVPLASLTEPEIISMIPFLTELQEEIVRRAFLRLRESGKKFSVDDLLYEIETVGSMVNARSQTIDIARDRTSMLKRARIIGEGVNWPDLLRPEGFINIDCRRLAHSELHAIAGAVARELLGLRMGGRIPPFVFSVDEAHMFIPYNEDTPSSQVIRELIRFGRHYGIGLILITPSPTDIDRRIIRITNTRFIFAIEPDQLNALRGVFADAPTDLIARLPKLERGSCLLTGSWETVKHAVLIKVRLRRTTHGGATPDVIKELDKFR